MDIDYLAWRFWIDIAQVLGLIGLAVYTWFVNRTKANSQAIEVLEEKSDKRFSDHHTRLSVIEKELTHVPGEPEVGRIHNRIDQVGQGVKHIEGEMKQMNATLHLIQQYLLEKGK